MKHFLLLSLVLACCFSCQSTERDALDISGEWTVGLDSLDNGLERGWQAKAFSQSMRLPGTTDDAGLGIPNGLQPALEKPQLLHLTRKHSYLGAAWYSRTIKLPERMKGKDFILKLERIIWKTDVWIDGQQVPGSNTSLVAPHYFDLTPFINPGKEQRITIRVDNRKLYDISVDNLAHAYTNDTQIIWNGVIGEMEIEAVDPVRIDRIRIDPDIYTGKISVQLEIVNSMPGQIEKGELSLAIRSKNGTGSFPVKKEEVQLNPSSGTFTTEVEMGPEAKLWDEFNPHLYEVTATLRTKSTHSVKTADFGLRQIAGNVSTLLINDHPVFLRGTLECNIFPLTGHPPMDKEGWKKVFGAAREWGLNHLRFHSWCPPRAAFEVADEMGFYLQVELPAWTLAIGQDQATTDFLYAEAERMIREYGNHPSFCFWSLGNELQGDMSVLSGLLDHLKQKDNRHLYTTTSFTFEAGHGAWPEPNDDFFITQWTKKGWVRGQGVFNSAPPAFDKDYSASTEGIPVPLVTHEIGQYAVYPNLKEISKYTGVLDPLNFKAIKKDLEQKGLLHKADDYTTASGKLAALLYKEEIERALKTKEISGFQLLDLHDFPGQGTALVGLLDAFWDSKGVIDASGFREFCSSVVPLLSFPKAVYLNDEVFTARIDLSNYLGRELKQQQVEWKIVNEKGESMHTGETTCDLMQGYNTSLAEFTASLSTITKASKLTVQVQVKDTDYRNHWHIWVYPARPQVPKGDVFITRDLQEAYSLVSRGNKVLFTPDWKKTKGLEGKFVPVFWSPVHFPRQAGSMGLLCDPAHPAFHDFPTDMHTDWQWWDLAIHSTTVQVDSICGGTPLVEVVDNFTNNRRLAIVYEGSILKGKLLIATCDLYTDLDNRPVARQLLISLLNYMNSDEFAPEPIQNPQILKSVFEPKGETNTKAAATSIY
ncbi:MAG: glycoside hydrolase family 2 [Tannerellaceae bacterium]|nr:glycoside hydrolase family 2 [Tannerellaceae bacterium]